MREMIHVSRGISLLEILLVVAILAIIGVAGAGYFSNTVQRIESGEISKVIISDIKNMRAKSMVGDGAMKWGIHVVNNANDYYELFSTPTNYTDALTVVVSTTTLSRGITFTDPGESGSKDIIFSKISGTTTAATIGIFSEGQTTTVTVTAQGAVY